MSTHDTSHHEIRHGESVTTSMKQGDDTSLNPAHGEAMDNTRHFNKGGHSEQYIPSGLDPHRTDPIPAIEKMERNEH